MPSKRDKLYGEKVMTSVNSERYREAATQLIKRYSEEGALDDIDYIERNGDEVSFSFEEYDIRTFSVLKSDGLRKHALASEADREEIQSVLRKLGEDVKSHTEKLVD